MAETAENLVAPATEEKPKDKPLTAERVKLKVKQMIVDLLNRGTSAAYTPRMISNAHTFEQLHMTEHEKRRLIFQNEELYGIELPASAEGTVRVGDLADMVVNALKQKELLEE